MNNEPEAYYKDFSDGTRLFFKSDELYDIDNSDNLIKPLYTADKLQPRVKMTKKQYDRLMWDKQNTDLLNCLGYFLNGDYHHFGLPSEDLRGDLTPEDIARAWLNPEETVDIVPEKKWFVRSKSSDEKYGYWYLHKTEHFFFHEYIKEISTEFDTKEEAEQWKNPLTEVVQLPVEEQL